MHGLQTTNVLDVETATVACSHRNADVPLEECLHCGSLVRMRFGLEPPELECQVPDGNRSNGNSHHRILDAAARLVAERGYGATTISMIIRATGLPASSLYWHFGSKEALMAAVVDDGVADVMRTLPSSAAGLEGEAAVAALLDTSVQRSQSRRLLLLAAFQRAANAESIRAVARFRLNLKERFAKAFADLAGQGRAAASNRRHDTMPTLALAAWDGLNLGSQLDPEEADWVLTARGVASNLVALARSYSGGFEEPAGR